MIAQNETVRSDPPVRLWTATRQRGSRNSFRARLFHSRQVCIGVSLLLLLALLSLLAPVLTPYDPTEISPTENLQPPSYLHPLGTDQYGRDMLSRVLYGGRISLTVGFLALASAFGIGISVGMISGFYGGSFDFVCMRVIDILLAFPAVLLGLLVVATLGPGLGNVMVAIGISWSPAYIRFVRGLTLQVKVKDFIEASRALGATNMHLVLRHVFPNVLPSVVVFASLALGGTILAAAGLSFLGLGAQPPTPEWGATLSQGRDYLRHAWWVMVFPGLAITLTVVGSNMLGDGLRDVFDPSLRL